MQQLAKQAGAARLALRQATEAEPFDENAVRTASSGLGAVMADQAVLRAKVRAEVMQILTPEQRAKAAELRTRADQRMQQRRQRLEQRRQPLNQATPKPGA
jgi:Spy/CpxP family protein refolding chaperone